MEFESVLGARCPVCGGDLDAPGLCRRCRSELYARRWQNLVYLGGYRKWRGAVRALKFKGGRRLVAPLADALAEGMREAGWGLDAVTAVPTTWWRALVRGYNPAELLGRRIAERLELPFVRAVARRYTPSQTRRRRDERARMKAGTFFLQRELEHRRWLLVDDVWTTGATFRAVERVLRAGGAEAVYGAVIAARQDGDW